MSLDYMLHPTYDELHAGCETIVNNVNRMSVSVERVIGVSRGGLVPGVIVSHLMDLPFTPVSYSSSMGAGDNKNHQNYLPDIAESCILIVDDICDTSRTLSEIVDHYQAAGKDVYTAVLHYKTRRDGKHIPDFYWNRIPEDAGWVVYPFERREDR